MEWAVRFSRAMEEAEIVFLSGLYYQDLRELEVSEKEFELLLAHVNRTCRFFPTMADILDARTALFTTDDPFGSGARLPNWGALKQLAPCYEGAPEIPGSKEQRRLLRR